MNFYEYLEFEESLKLKDTQIWPLLKFSIYSIERKSKVGSIKREVKILPLILMLCYSFALFSYYIIRGKIGRAYSGLLFGASTRLNSEGDWLLNENIRKGYVPLYHVQNFDLKTLRNLVSNRAVAYNLVASSTLFIQKFIVKSERLCLTTSEHALITEICKSKITKNLEISPSELEMMLVRVVRKFKLDQINNNFFIDKFNLENKKAIIVSSYSKTDLVASLHSLSFHVTDYQHGLVAPFQPISCCSDLIKSDLIVDSYALYSDFWVDIFGKHTSKEVFKFKPENHKLDDLPSNFKRDYIIFTSQDENYDLVINFIDLFLTENPFLLFVYRAHPREKIDNSIIQNTFKKHENFYFSTQESEPSTRVLIKHAKAHFSISSACHFDAFELKGESYFVPPRNLLLFPDKLVDSELSQYFKKIEDFRDNNEI